MVTILEKYGLEKPPKHQPVSVIIPTYNEPRLKSTLKSLIPQLKNGDQVIVVDNADDPQEQVGGETIDFDSPSIHLFREPRPGAYPARILGAAYAENPILAFLDADCQPMYHWLDAGRAAATRCGGMVACNIATIAEGRSLIERYDAATAIPQEIHPVEGRVCAGNLFITRECYEAIGGFDASVKSGPDFGLVRRVKEAGYDITYEEYSMVHHPARKTLSSILKKVKRMAHASANRNWPTPRRLKLIAGARRAIPWVSLIRHIWRQDGLKGWERSVFTGIYCFTRAYGAYQYLKGGEQPRR